MHPRLFLVTPLTADPGYLLTPTGTLYYVVGSCHNDFGLLIRVAEFTHRKGVYTVTLDTLKPAAYRNRMAGAQRLNEPSIHPTTGADLTGARRRLAERLAALQEGR